MMGVQWATVVFGVVWGRLANFDWKKLAPKITHERYSYGAVGIELTWPWRQGLGVGVGLGVIDVWMGWPRTRKSLHHEGCEH